MIGLNFCGSSAKIAYQHLRLVLAWLSLLSLLLCSCQFRLEEGGSRSLTLFHHSFGSAFCDDVATTAATFGTHVDDVVCHFDHVEIVLNDNHRIAFVHQLVEYVDEHTDVLKMKTCGGFIENLDGVARVALGEFGR